MHVGFSADIMDSISKPKPRNKCQRNNLNYSSFSGEIHILWHLLNMDGSVDKWIILYFWSGLKCFVLYVLICLHCQCIIIISM